MFKCMQDVFAKISTPLCNPVNTKRSTIPIASTVYLHDNLQWISERLSVRRVIVGFLRSLYRLSSAQCPSRRKSSVLFLVGILWV
jgi:hypothetical protein